MSECIIKSFENMAEYLTWVENTPPVGNCTQYSHKYDEYASFCGTQTWEQALELIEGWHDGAAKIEQLANLIFDAISSKIERVDTTYDIEGAGIDIARYLDGEPECWQKFETNYIDGRGNRVLQLVFNCGVSAGISQDIIIRKGSLITALIKSLEFAGYRVEGWVLACCDTHFPVELRIKIKEAGQDVDMPRLAFALAHPSMLRRLVFAGWERIKESVSYSSAYPIESDFQGDIYCNKSDFLEPQWANPSKATTWLVEQLKKQGVQLHDLQDTK